MGNTFVKGNGWNLCHSMVSFATSSFALGSFLLCI